ncbi:alpha/beta hydrolase family protein [Thalassotalea hakodatensis]|uniref:alpha/beta hydrolase family protein n=1 Tax=Thalassotalea hakodatensis TaxID=3030492 RepID=UPI0025743E5B|nr:alpha/beta fold hydrolase [Thalassotalea hakodatensis]
MQLFFSSINFFILFFIFTFSVHAKTSDPLISIETYSQSPNKSLVRISPSGKLLAYRLTEQNRDLFVVVDLTTKKVVRGFDVSGIDPKNAYFISETQLILIMEKRSKIRGFIGRYDISTAYLYDIDKNKVSQLLNPGKGIYDGQTELGNIIGVSKDYKFAYMTAYAQRSKNAVPKNSIMKVNLDKPYKTPRVHIEGGSNVIDYFLDQDNNLLARERFDQENNIHTVEVLHNDDWKVIFSDKTPYITHGISGVMPDNKHLIMTLNQTGSDQDVFTLNLDSGVISPASFGKKNKDIEHVLTDINQQVYGIEYSGFTPSYTFFDEKLEKQFAEIKDELPNSNLTLTSVTPNRDKVIVFAEWDGLAGDFLSYNNKKLAHVARLWKDITWEDVHTVIDFKFKTRDGVIIPTLLTLPTIAEGDKSKLPAIVLPHGGPESYDKKTFYWLAQYFANRGYLVIQPQFRGSTGFGAEHTLLGRGQWGKSMQDDLTDSVTALINMGEIDSNRVCIVGISYGGYAALAGAAFTPDVYQCAVSINGVSDIAEMLEQEEDNHGRDSSILAYWQEVTVNNNIEKEELDAISPAKHAANINVPVLLIHGTDDMVVPIEQSEIMVEAMEDANKKVEFIKLKMEGHHLKQNQSKIIILKALDKFISNHIG